jgi:hypothetical protein
MDPENRIKKTAPTPARARGSARTVGAIALLCGWVVFTGSGEAWGGNDTSETPLKDLLGELSPANPHATIVRDDKGPSGGRERPLRVEDRRRSRLALPAEGRILLPGDGFEQILVGDVALTSAAVEEERLDRARQLMLEKGLNRNPELAAFLFGLTPKAFWRNLRGSNPLFALAAGRVNSMLRHAALRGVPDRELANLGYIEAGESSTKRRARTDWLWLVPTHSLRFLSQQLLDDRLLVATKRGDLQLADPKNHPEVHRRLRALIGEPTEQDLQDIGDLAAQATGQLKDHLVDRLRLATDSQEQLDTALQMAREHQPEKLSRWLKLLARRPKLRTLGRVYGTGKVGALAGALFKAREVYELEQGLWVNGALKRPDRESPFETTTFKLTDMNLHRGTQAEIETARGRVVYGVLRGLYEGPLDYNRAAIWGGVIDEPPFNDAFRTMLEAHGRDAPKWGPKDRWGPYRWCVENQLRDEGIRLPTRHLMETTLARWEPPLYGGLTGIKPLELDWWFKEIDGILKGDLEGQPGYRKRQGQVKRPLERGTTNMPTTFAQSRLLWLAALAGIGDEGSTLAQRMGNLEATNRYLNEPGAARLRRSLAHFHIKKLPVPSPAVMLWWALRRAGPLRLTGVYPPRHK